MKQQFIFFAPVVIAVALLVALWLIAETGHARLQDATRALAVSQQRLVQLASFQQLMFDAETSQRGFLLTENPKYLQTFDPAVRQLEPLLDQLQESYIGDALRPQLAASRRLRLLTGIKLGEMLGSLRLYGEKNRDAAMALIDTDMGKKTMDDLRREWALLQGAERTRVRAVAASWEKDLLTSRRLIGAGTALNIGLVVLAGLLIARDARRREAAARELAFRNSELDRLVQERTAELSDLSSHLQNVSEIEKAALARELHDELGGLLVATKMDVMWLRRHLDKEAPELNLRWERVVRALESGVEFKRRIIESLRPTLLDNLGLAPALRWLTTESCGSAGLKCEVHYPDDIPDLAPAASIAVFRAVQESLTNVVKHANASNVSVEVRSDTEKLIVAIRDDGVGIPADRIALPQSHGLAGMRHRIHAVGGQLRVGRLQSGPGTQVTLILPWARIRADVAEAAEGAGSHV